MDSEKSLQRTLKNIDGTEIWFYLHNQEQFISRKTNTKLNSLLQSNPSAKNALILVASAFERKHGRVRLIKNLYSGEYDKVSSEFDYKKYHYLRVWERLQEMTEVSVDDLIKQLKLPKAPPHYSQALVNRPDCAYILPYVRASNGALGEWQRTITITLDNHRTTKEEVNSLIGVLTHGWNYLRDNNLENVYYKDIYFDHLKFIQHQVSQIPDDFWYQLVKFKPRFKSLAAYLDSP